MNEPGLGQDLVCRSLNLRIGRCRRVCTVQWLRIPIQALQRECVVAGSRIIRTFMFERFVRYRVRIMATIKALNEEL
jgi:hypothetical protein